MTEEQLYNGNRNRGLFSELEIVIKDLSEYGRLELRYTTNKELIKELILTKLNQEMEKLEQEFNNI